MCHFVLEKELSKASNSRTPDVFIPLLHSLVTHRPTFLLVPPYQKINCNVRLLDLLHSPCTPAFKFSPFWCPSSPPLTRARDSRTGAPSRDLVPPARSSCSRPIPQTIWNWSLRYRSVNLPAGWLSQSVTLPIQLLPCSHRVFPFRSPPIAWAAAYPASTPDANAMPQAWKDALAAAEKAGKIPNIPPSSSSNKGNPVYPSGYDPLSAQVCSATYKCRIAGDIWDAPQGVIGISFDDGPLPVSVLFTLHCPTSAAFLRPAVRVKTPINSRAHILALLSSHRKRCIPSFKRTT